MTFLYYLLAFLTMYVPYRLFGWPGLAIVFLVTGLAHAMYRYRTGRWMTPL